MCGLGVTDAIRGFSTNVANYQTLGLASLCPAEAFAQAGVSVHGAVQGVSQWCKDASAGGRRRLLASGASCCADDPCRVLGLGSGGATELSYVQSLQKQFELATGWRPHFIIDTGRNGNPSSRTSCTSWCNVRGAGAGHAPTMNTPLPDVRVDGAARTMLVDPGAFHAQ